MTSIDNATEPARGDTVHVHRDPAYLRTGEVTIPAERYAALLDAAEAAERRGYDAAMRAVARVLDGEPRGGTWSGEAGHVLERVERLRDAGPHGTFARAYDLLRREARPDESSEQVVERLIRERDALRARVAELETGRLPCTCGSGAHPRRCEAHPLAYDAHCARLRHAQEDEERAYRDGAEAMRERAAEHLESRARDASLPISPQQTRREAAAEIRALPLDDDAREDAQPFDLRAHLARQIEWSRRTFGPGPRAAGVVDHIRKELREIEAAPDDLEEWIDVVILALDGAWRAGHSPDEVVAQLVAKQAKNERRQWPDWRVADFNKAIEHVREDAQGGDNEH